MLDYFMRVTPANVLKAVEAVILNPDFQLWSGSGSPDKHHYGDGGLMVHTYEVARHAQNIVNTHKAISGENLFWDELLVAVVWHDFGKIWDYQKPEGTWCKRSHAREIHHVSRSAIEFQKFVALNKAVCNFDVEHSTHMILSHHGRREWGSPVAPYTQEAWVLHLADALSARLDDWHNHPVG